MEGFCGSHIGYVGEHVTTIGYLAVDVGTEVASPPIGFQVSLDLQLVGLATNSLVLKVSKMYINTHIQIDQSEALTMDVLELYSGI